MCNRPVFLLETKIMHIIKIKRTSSWAYLDKAYANVINIVDLKTSGKVLITRSRFACGVMDRL